MKAVGEMTGKELVEEYNALTKKNITKFQDRATAERRVLEARKEHAPKPAQGKKRDKPVWPFEGKPQIVAPEKKPKAEKKAPVDNEARRVKNHVRVAGVEYRSVAAAFEALGLPMNKHIKFRAKLKASGAETFDGHDFIIVKGE